MQTTCSIEGCDGPVKTRGWCQAHYVRWRHTGSTGSPVVVRRQRGRVCSIDGCGRKHQGRGYCDTHLQRFVKYGDPGAAEIEPRNPGATCSIDGCESTAAGRGWCNAHLIRWRKTGDPLTPIPEHPGTWTGEDATYNAVHFRLRHQRGRAAAQTCECGEPAAEWAYDHSKSEPKVDPEGKPYSTDLARYIPLCRSCHRRLDARRGRTEVAS